MYTYTNAMDKQEEDASNFATADSAESKEVLYIKLRENY